MNLNLENQQWMMNSDARYVQAWRAKRRSFGEVEVVFEQRSDVLRDLWHPSEEWISSEWNARNHRIVLERSIYEEASLLIGCVDRFHLSMLSLRRVSLELVHVVRSDLPTRNVRCLDRTTRSQCIAYLVRLAVFGQRRREIVLNLRQSTAQFEKNRSDRINFIDVQFEFLDFIRFSMTFDVTQ